MAAIPAAKPSRLRDGQRCRRGLGANAAEVRLKERSTGTDVIITFDTRDVSSTATFGFGTVVPTLTWSMPD